jgi:hypothetical protein
MVRCFFITSPETSPETPPFIASYVLLRRKERLRVGALAGMVSPPTHCANVGGHASQRDTCHVCLLCAVATLGSVASYVCFLCAVAYHPDGEVCGEMCGEVLGEHLTI